MYMIYKAVLSLSDKQELMLPKNSDILAVQYQNENLCLWYKFDDCYKNMSVIRKIYIFGTGNLIPDKILKHIGTVQDGQFVWHVFEE
jgi:hypothetical protein